MTIRYTLYFAIKFSSSAIFFSFSIAVVSFTKFNDFNVRTIYISNPIFLSFTFQITKLESAPPDTKYSSLELALSAQT